MRIRALVGFLLLLASASLYAAGTATVTKTIPIVGVSRFSIAWTATAGGGVSANPFTVPAGELLEAKFVPGTGGTQPSDLYDITLVDTDGVDVLAGNGGNLSNAAAALRVPLIGDGSGKTHRVFLDGTQQLDLVVANAGASKTGTVILLIGR